MPLAHPAGHAQADFGEAGAIIAGVLDADAARIASLETIVKASAVAAMTAIWCLFGIWSSVSIEVGTRARFNAHLQNLIEPAIADRQGRIVKTTGDALLTVPAAGRDRWSNRHRFASRRDRCCPGRRHNSSSTIRSVARGVRVAVAIVKNKGRHFPDKLFLPWRNR